MTDKYMVYKRSGIGIEALGGGIWQTASFPVNHQMAETIAEGYQKKGFQTEIREYVSRTLATPPDVSTQATAQNNEAPSEELLPAVNDEIEAETKFREFHQKNPAVYEAMVKMAKELKEHGHSKIGVQMLIEVIRWRSMIETTDTDFKINNNYGARYARLIMKENPTLDRIFELRKMEGEHV